MAAIQVCDAFGIAMLGTLLNQTGPITTFTYHLFANDLTPDPATLIAAFTEVTLTGYAAQTFTAAGWTVAPVVSGHTKATNTIITFTMTDPGTIFGYWVTDNTGALVWSQRFDTTITLGPLGGSILIEPTLEVQSPI